MSWATIKRFLEHHESSEDWRLLGHPLVCGFNMVGVVVTLYLVLIAYQPRPTLLLLPVVVIFQYTVSCVYHWRPRSNGFWHKMDYQAILLLTGVTMVPYWTTHLSQFELGWRLLAITVLTVGACWLRWFRFTRDMLGGALSLGLASFALGISWNGLMAWLPPLDWWMFWVGIFCYFASFFINKNKWGWPEMWKGLYGYREFQHFPWTLAGTTLQILVQLRNL